ncbi:hypothetical protein [Nannocystis pusilla]|uniref:hypothetical protein n=1 Tax=Nannocystis pusilla TaxID=889268 RepID=UPI003B80EDB3
MLVEDGGPYVHHAATEADVREILRRMPRGRWTGSGRFACVSATSCARELRPREDEPADPWTGRPGCEVLPGVYGPATAGLYDRQDASIWLHAFVHAPGAPGPFGIYLKLRTLAVLVHELSRHYDYMFRTRGDRWRMDPGYKTETYANTRAFGVDRGLRRAVLARALRRRVRGVSPLGNAARGVLAPLEVLVDDRPGRMGLGDAFLALVFALAAGEDLLDARAEYAEILAMDGRDEDAQQVIDGVLGERPEHAGALVTRAVLAVRRGYNDVAEHSCRSALASSPDAVLVELLLGRLLRSQARWQELADRTTHALTRRGRDHRLLVLRARAGWSCSSSTRRPRMLPSCSAPPITSCGAKPPSSTP